MGGPHLTARDQDGYSVLISFATKEEADVAASALRADGVDAFVGNAHHANKEWWAVAALGGLQVLVPSARLVEAKQLLRERLVRSMDVGVDDFAVRRDRWKAWTMFAFTIAPLLATFLLWLALMIGSGFGLAERHNPWVARQDMGPADFSVPQPPDGEHVPRR